MSTPMSESIEQAATALAQARTSLRAIPPISSTYNITELEAAYAVAERNTKLRL